MITSHFKVERSNLGTYLRVQRYSYSLIDFLNEHNMLKDEYKMLATPNVKQKVTTLYVPVKLAKKLPFILAATTCRQLSSCLCNTSNLNLVKSRLKNYYCEDYFEKIVSVFGNDKAWNEFEIASQWKPKFRFVATKHYCGVPVIPYFKFMTYNLCSRRHRVITTPYVDRANLLVEIYWNDNKETIFERDSWTSIVLSRINMSKSRFSRFINNPNISEKVLSDFKEAISIVDANQKLLSKDGLKLQKDLNMIRNLAL